MPRSGESVSSRTSPEKSQKDFCGSIIPALVSRMGWEKIPYNQVVTFLTRRILNLAAFCLLSFPFLIFKYRIKSLPRRMKFGIDPGIIAGRDAQATVSCAQSAVARSVGLSRAGLQSRRTSKPTPSFLAAFCCKKFPFLIFYALMDIRAIPLSRGVSSLF